MNRMEILHLQWIAIFRKSHTSIEESCGTIVAVYFDALIGCQAQPMSLRMDPLFTVTQLLTGIPALPCS